MDPHPLIVRWALLASVAWAIPACKDVRPAAGPAPSAGVAVAGTTVLPRPLPLDTPSSKKAGAALFLRACSHCHGDGGRGDGPAGRACDPPPADFRDDARLAGLTDAAIFERLTVGKAGTCMPSFKASLSEDERLLLVRQVRWLAAERRTDVSGGAL